MVGMDFRIYFHHNPLIYGHDGYRFWGCVDNARDVDRNLYFAPHHFSADIFLDTFYL